MTRTARTLLTCLPFVCAGALARAAPGERRAATSEQGLEAPARARVELDYRVGFRGDDQASGRLAVSAKGTAPSDLRLAGALFFEGSWLGLAAGLAWEPYGLKGTDIAGNGVTLAVTAVRLHGGLAARAALAPRLWLEGEVGYGLASLPAVGSARDGLFAEHLLAHGPALAALLVLERERLAPALRLSATPYATGVLDGVRLRGAALGAGAQLGLWTFAWGGGALQVAATYEYQLDRLSNGAAHLNLGAHQIGLGLRGAFLVPERPAAVAAEPALGLVKGRVRLGAAAAGAGVVVEAVGRRSVLTDDAGAFELRVPPGPLTLKVEVRGWPPAQKTVEVLAGVDNPVVVQLARRDGPGRIVGVVRDGKAALPGVAVEARGAAAPARTDDAGAFELAEVGPGPVALQLSLDGYQSAEELVAVPPDGEARVELLLHKKAARALATLRGLVRSLAGAPLSARLRVVEPDLRAGTEPDGSFRVQVPGGRYHVTIEVPGYIPQTKAVEVADGDQAIFNIDMHPVQ